MANDAFLGIVHTVLLRGALAQPLNELLDITADQVKNLDNRNLRLQQGSLLDRSRDAVKNEDVVLGMVGSSRYTGLEIVQAQ
jgi:hypothetical protein